MRITPLITLLLTGMLILGCAEYPDAMIDEVGVLIVLNKSDDTAYILDRQTGERLAVIETGFQPHEVAVSPDGRTAVVTNYGTRERPGNSLTVIDIARAERIKDISLLEYTMPHGIQFLDDTRVIVTTEGRESVLTVDIETEAIQQVFMTEQHISHMVAALPDGSRAFVPNIGSGTVTVLDLETGLVEAHIPTGEGAEGIAISPDGMEVWVTNRGANTVSVIDAQTLEVIFELPSPEFPIRAEFSPDGRHVVVTNAQSGDITVFDANEKLRVGVIRLDDIEQIVAEDDRYFMDQFEDSPIPIGVVIGPDNRTAYVANTAADVVAVVDIITLEVMDLYPTGAEPDGIAWAPVRPEL
jgi:YVTN family beta-propeller protein